MIKSLFVVILVCETIAAWNLAPLNIANDTSIIHVSVYYGRAFLCLENDRDLYAPTLIEATWPENALGIKPKVFPNDKVHQRRQGKCRGIQKARATDVDPKGRLWLIDNGSDSCHPKLSIYDLLYMNEEIQFQTFNSMKNKKFSSIIVDPTPCDNGDLRAYLSLYDEDYLLVYSLDERKIGKLKFINNYIQPTKSLSFSEIVIAKQDTMYLSDVTTGNLYSLNMIPVRYLNFSILESKKLSIKSPLTYIGMLLGSPKSLTINQKGQLFYILARDSAVVSWNPRTPLLAEWHEVIYQTSANLTQLLFGQKGSVYAISPKVFRKSHDGRDKHCIKIHVE